MSRLSATAFQRLLDSRVSLALALALGNLMPRGVGYLLADWVATHLIAPQRDSPAVRAVRANQWVVNGEKLTSAALDAAVNETLRNTARALFDLYHYLARPEATRRLYVLDEGSQSLLHRPEFAACGLVVAGLHMSAFDLILQSLCRQGMKPLVLTIPNPQGGRRMEFEIRRRSGMNLLPASIPAMRKAVHHLRQGGIVLTGIDRPVESPSLRPRFFGRPSVLPTHHTYLALKADVPIVVMAARHEADGKYHVYTSAPLTMEGHAPRGEELLYNTERILDVAAAFIRQAPHQWSISLPVWPEVMELTL
jgi:KDO2-lipid IV(A) lauroyltransferase